MARYMASESQEPGHLAWFGMASLSEGMLEDPAGGLRGELVLR